MANIDPQQFGVSFSAKQCRNFRINARECFRWLVEEAGFRRFRLMSYWDEHERSPGDYDFSGLDWQIEMIEQAGGEVSLCLGARQPRWPENHWPDWAWQLPKEKRTAALLVYISDVVERYKSSKAVVSYQLENEALLKAFGTRSEVDRGRLRKEFDLVRSLDPSRPVIMTTSTSWGIPIRKPIPQVIGFSYYQIIYNGKRYSTAFHTPLLHRTRKRLIQLLKNRPVFIHELQLEPWGPKAIWEMPTSEQDKSMSPAQIKRNVLLARKVGALPIDIWGGEWWYWRLTKHNDPTIWRAVQEAITEN